MSAPPRYPTTQGNWPEDGGDYRPEPGGVYGGPVDYVRWYPPDTPFLWGQGFPTPWGLNYFSQWTQQFLPTTTYQLPIGVTDQMFPHSFGRAGTFQTQLNGAVPVGTANSVTVDELNKHADAQVAGSFVQAVGAFGRV